jgi:hypothetical protein
MYVCGTHTHSRSEWTLAQNVVQFSQSQCRGACGGEPVGGTDLLSPTACAPAARHPHPRTVQVTRVRGLIYNTFAWGARYTSLVAILYQQFSGKRCICRYMSVSIKKRTSFSPLTHIHTHKHICIHLYVYAYVYTFFFFFFFKLRECVCIYICICVPTNTCICTWATQGIHMHTPFICTETHG